MPTQSYRLAASSFLAAILLASGAAAAEPVKPCGPETGTNSDFMPIRSEVVQWPAAGETNTVEIGQSLISQAREGMYATAIILDAPLEFSGAPWLGVDKRPQFKVIIPPGRYPLSRPKVGDDRWGGKLIGYAGTFDAPNSGLTRAKDGAPYPKAILQIIGFPTDELGVQWQLGMNWWVMRPRPEQFRAEVCSGVGPNAFRHELVYGGVAKGVIKLTYREFALDANRTEGGLDMTSWLARPSFTQELTYDLAEGKEIGFRGARFEVIKATNIDLTYRVIKPLAAQ